MINTLVIHPDDRSTDFLKLIYKDKDYTVLNFEPDSEGNSLLGVEYGNYISMMLMDYIKEFDRIIMLGHGTPGGLINPKAGGYLIDDSFAEVLKKKEVVSIWCNSDKYFKANEIFTNQFHSGMIISECLEQLFVLGKVYLNYKEQLQNMELFSRVVGECIEKSPNEMRDYILEHYVGDDPVTQYNRRNLFVF